MRQSWCSSSATWVRHLRVGGTCMKRETVKQTNKQTNKRRGCYLAWREQRLLAKPSCSSLRRSSSTFKPILEFLQPYLASLVTWGDAGYRCDRSGLSSTERVACAALEMLLCKSPWALSTEVANPSHKNLNGGDSRL